CAKEDTTWADFDSW
nr:immunoglobulin heavy chain junction region [Macaca mulatta]